MAITPFRLECKFNSSLQPSYLRPLRSLLGLLFLYDHHQFAVSGGMMGGSDFSSSDHYSYSDHSSTYYSDHSSTYYSSSRRISSQAPMKAANHEFKKEDIIILSIIIALVIFGIVFIILIASPEDPSQKGVVKLQVGSLNTGRSLQRDLNRIAEVASTSTANDWKFVLQESILSLLRHSNYSISGYSSVDGKTSVAECEERFNQRSIEERSKFEELTLVNVNNIRKKSAASQSSNGLPNKYNVVTIIMAARSVPELPPVKNSAQLKEALLKLASIPASDIMAAQVLWTPQKEDDSLTETKLLKDYPLLNPL